MLPAHITAAHPGYRYEIQSQGKSDLTFIQFSERRTVAQARDQGYVLDSTDYPQSSAVLTIHDGITSADLIHVLLDREMSRADSSLVVRQALEFALVKLTRDESRR